MSSIADAHRKRQIGPPTAVKVAQFTASHAKLDPAEPVRGDRHVRPLGNFANDLLLNALGHWWLGLICRAHIETVLEKSRHTHFDAYAHSKESAVYDAPASTGV